MDETPQSVDETPQTAATALPLILIAAVIQGWALYGLHVSVRDRHWPATHDALLPALYAVVVFIPLTLQLLAEYRRSATLWACITLMSAALFYFGWHHGSRVAVHAEVPAYMLSSRWELVTFVMAVMWLHLLPFVQCRLASGAWRPQYRLLFAASWRNVLILAEAGLFTGLLWLLLFLLLSLFHMLGIDYFKELFEEPIFAYPVTALAFGVAIHLIGSIDRLTSVALEQILNLLKWLAVLAGLILAMFSVALLMNLPKLVFTGDKAIGAHWLLWLVAGMVLLLNAAYRDGSDLKPYPRWIGMSLRAVVPLLVLIAATALYALCVRVQHFGLTVSRVWAFVVAAAALLYSSGYAVSAFGRNGWFAGMARVNIAVALALVAVIAATFTPLLSPFRLAADSQYHLVVARGVAALEREPAHEDGYRMGDQPLKYLRFYAGRYGLEQLRALSQLQSGKDAEQIRTAAEQMLATNSPYNGTKPLDPKEALGRLAVFPAGRILEPALTDVIVADTAVRGVLLGGPLTDGLGVFMDLNADGQDEFVLMMGYAEYVYEKRQGTWRHAGNLTLQNPQKSDRKALLLELKNSLQHGEFSSTPSTWRNLTIGTRSFEVVPTP